MSAWRATLWIPRPASSKASDPQLRQTLKSSAPAGLFLWSMQKNGCQIRAGWLRNRCPPNVLMPGGRGDAKRMKPADRQRVSFEFSAEGQGFEPWVPVREQRFSRPPRSTTPASFHGVALFCGAKIAILFKFHNYFSPSGIHMPNFYA